MTSRRCEGNRIAAKMGSEPFIAEMGSGDYPGGRGYLVYLSDGDVPFFRVSFSPIFSRTGYQKKVKFSGAGCQNMSNEEILLQRVIV